MRKATNIQWSINDSNVLKYLPTEIEIPVGMKEDAISDYLSEQTGYLHEGYVLEQDSPEKISSDLYRNIYGERDQYKIKFPNEELNKTIMQKTLEQFGQWNMCEYNGFVFVAYTDDLGKDIHFNYEYMISHCHEDNICKYMSYAEILENWITDIHCDINSLGVLDEQGNHNFYLTEQELVYCGLKEEYEIVKQENKSSIEMEPELDEIEM